MNKQLIFVFVVLVPIFTVVGLLWAKAQSFNLPASQLPQVNRNFNPSPTPLSVKITPPEILGSVNSISPTPKPRSTPPPGYVKVDFYGEPIYCDPEHLEEVGEINQELSNLVTDLNNCLAESTASSAGNSAKCEEIITSQKDMLEKWDLQISGYCVK